MFSIDYLYIDREDCDVFRHEFECVSTRSELIKVGEWCKEQTNDFELHSRPANYIDGNDDTYFILRFKDNDVASLFKMVWG